MFVISRVKIIQRKESVIPSLMTGMEDTNTILVLRRSTFTLRYTLKQHCSLRWRFKTEGLT